MSTRIVIADDHQFIRDGIRTLFSEEPDLEVVAEADNGKAVAQLARELSPELVIMDVGMPGDIDGIEATRQIIAENPSTKVIALSMHANKLFVEDMFAAGASGYLLKECAPRELLDAVHAILENEIYLSPRVASIAMDGKVTRPSVSQSTTPILTRKECEVVKLLASGQSTKQIAFQLKKSVQSIDAYRRQAMEKLGIDSLAELIKYAIREGLTDFDF